MKAILISIRPQHVANILNGKKTIEIRKKFPRDYVGWVYIYCTKETYLMQTDKGCFATKEYYMDVGAGSPFNSMREISGKVVARFWCDKVEEIKDNHYEDIFEYAVHSKQCIEKWQRIYRESCLSAIELSTYLKGKNGYAIHITKLEIFDSPKEISEFMKVSCKGCPFENTQTCHNNTDGRYCKLTRAPQSWCYIEI